MSELLIFSLIILFFYCFLILRFFYAWKKTPEYISYGKHSKFFISVVIPFQNESKNLEALIEGLKRQQYPIDKHEVILVDDHSTDDSLKIADMLTEDVMNIRCVRNNSIKGKKYALYTGIEQARGENILISDADCSFSPGWISIFASFISANPELKLISSGVKLKSNNSFIQSFQSLEFSSLIATGAASFFQKDPIMCNGANLAFKKELFLEAFDQMHPEINTGDDIFLMLYTKKNYPGKYAFLKNNNAFTISSALNNWKDLIMQRIRWSSKSTYYRDFYIIITAILVLFINTCLLILFISSFFQPVLFTFFLFFLFMKSIPDFLLLKIYLSFSRQKRLLKFFLPSQLINIIFIPLSGITGILLSPRRKPN